MQKSRKPEEHTTQNTCPPSADDAQQQRSLECQISGEKTLGGKPDPHTRRDGQSKPQDEVNLLPQRTFFTKQQRLELNRPHQSARHRGRHAQLDQELNQNKPRFHEFRRENCSMKHGWASLRPSRTKAL